MRMASSRTGIVLFAVLISPLGWAVNLAPNPRFEQKLAPWSLWPQRGTTTASVDTAVFRVGHSSARITITDPAQASNLYSYIMMAGGKHYRVRFWYKLKDFQISATGKVQVNLAFNRARGGNASAGNCLLPIPVTPGSGEWIEFDSEVTAPAQTAACQFIFSFLGVKGTIWLNDLVVEENASVVVIQKRTITSPLTADVQTPQWKALAPLTPFYDMNRSGSPARTLTTAFLTYDEQNLYIAFNNTEPRLDLVQCKVRAKDGPVWEDDCNEVFIQAPNGRTRQFVLNADNIRWDGELIQKVPGDPYQPRPQWDGVWQSVTGRARGGWVSVFKIPFSNFGQSPAAGQTWRINLARERHVDGEVSQWNRVRGSLNAIGKFGLLTFRDSTATLTRYEEAADEDPYRVARRTPRFKEVLTDQRGDYAVGSWGNFEYLLPSYSKELQSRYTPATWGREQENYFAEIGRAGMFGPCFPYCLDPKLLGKEKLERYLRQYGMKCPLVLFNSDLLRQAIKAGAQLTDGQTVVAFDAKLTEVKTRFLANFLTTNSELIPNLLFIEGEDEPTNVVRLLSPTANAGHREVLAKVDQEIRREFGFGKYGLYDPFATTADPQAAFSRIASTRWWNDRFARMLQTQRQMVKKLAPGIDYIGFNHNYVCDMDFLDVALADQYSDWSSADPYPTSTASSHGEARARYHVGFSTKFLHDLSDKKVRAILQGFIYSGGTPTPTDVREWASQALKNGARMIEWYTEGPARVTIPDTYREIIRLSHLIHDMNQVRQPETTSTAIFFSNVSKWGTNDVAAYAWYAAYVILGERNGAWFRFVSDTQLTLGREDLSRYKIVYVPQLKFSDRATAEKLIAFVKAGGRLVVLDPEALSFSPEGLGLPDLRRELLGGKLLGARPASHLLSRAPELLGLKIDARLPLTPLTHIEGEGKVLAFSIEPPADARIMAVFPDGKPAAYCRQVGKGQVLYFAAQPFGNADLTARPGVWDEVFRTLETAAGEKMGLDIWSFELPATGGEIPIQYVISPTRKGS